MDEKLKATIEKIVLLARQNSEFNQELRKALGFSQRVSISSDEKRVEHIEKYLGLDYYVDSKESITDYSFIYVPDVRAQLTSDNREMMRFRYGTRNHKIDFYEFCRYAQLQAEMLLNFYYEQKDTSMEEIKNHIANYNSTFKTTDNYSSLSSIPFTAKLWAYKNEFELFKFIDIWLNIKETRNELSHRSPDNINLSIEKYRKKLISLHIPLKQNGAINIYKVNNDVELKRIYDNNKKDCQTYNYLIWVNSKPYDEIIGAINTLAESVRDNL